MRDTQETVDELRKLAWTLSLCSARSRLDVPGEYIWAFPADQGFFAIQDRYRSIFSSGNSIKDPEVIDFVQNLQLNRHLLNPWITKQFEEAWPGWISQSDQYSLRNLDLFTYTGYSQGTQETFLNFYFMNKHKRFRVFKGEYWWHMDIWQKTQTNWAYIEDDDIKPGDICMVSYPFALTGRKHRDLDWLLERCESIGVDLLLDFIYLPNSMDREVDIDLSADCIRSITFSLSKTFPVQCAKIAVRMHKLKPQDPMQMSNDENINNRLGSGLGLDLISRYGPSDMVKRYRSRQHYWCDKLGIAATKVVHFAVGPDYTNHGRENRYNFCSPFNQQHNRYNLGILYENESLLKILGFAD